MTTTIKLSDFTTHSSAEYDEITCHVSGLLDTPDRFWMRIYAEESGIFPDTSKWAVAALLYPAMAQGCDIDCEAPLESDFLFNINGDVQVLLQLNNPDLHLIKVTAPIAVPNTGSRPKGSATGFSGGIDSYVNVHLLTQPEVPDAMRLSCLAIFNVGAFGPGEVGERLFATYLERTKTYAAEFAVDWIGVNSNLWAYMRYPDGTLMSHMRNHTMRGAAAALACEGRIGTYHYGSTIPYQTVSFTPSRDSTHTDAMILPLLSAGKTQMQSLGSAYTRMEKINLVATMPHSYTHLDICTASADERLNGRKINCGHCDKCSREMMTLDALGQLEKYDAVFDLDDYQKHRNSHIALTLQTAQSVRTARVYQAAISQARKSWGRLPLTAVLLAQIYRLRDWSKNMLRPLVRRAKGTR